MHEAAPSFEVEFDDAGAIILERSYQTEAERLIAETFAQARAGEITTHAEQSARTERGILTILNQKLGRLGRLGLMMGALTGVVQGLDPARVEAPAPPPRPMLIPQEGVAQALIRTQVGDRPLFALSQDPVLDAAMVKERRNIPINGFEERPEKRKVIEATLASLPSSFLYNIEKLSYEDRAIGMGAEYGLTGAQEVAHCNLSTYEVVFAKASESYGPFMTSSTMQHEACHLNAPDTHRGLEPGDRHALYRTLLARVQAADRYHSSYVESINNPDPQIQLYRKASEYWAETCEAYLSGMPDLPPADHAMIRALIEKTDPSYTEEAFQQARSARGRALLKISEAKPKPTS